MRDGFSSLKRLYRVKQLKIWILVFETLRFHQFMCTANLLTKMPNPLYCWGCFKNQPIKQYTAAQLTFKQSLVHDMVGSLTPSVSSSRIIRVIFLLKPENNCVDGNQGNCLMVMVKLICVQCFTVYFPGAVNIWWVIHFADESRWMQVSLFAFLRYAATTRIRANSFVWSSTRQQIL